MPVYNIYDLKDPNKHIGYINKSDCNCTHL